MQECRTAKTGIDMYRLYRAIAQIMGDRERVNITVLNVRKTQEAERKGA